MEKYKFENNKAVVDLQCIITISKSSVSIEHASNTDSVDIPDAGLTILVGNVESYNPTSLSPEPAPEIVPNPQEGGSSGGSGGSGSQGGGSEQEGGDTPSGGGEGQDPTPTPTPGDTNSPLNNPVITIGINLKNNTSSSIYLDGDIVFIMGNPDHNGNYFGRWSDGSPYKLSLNRTDHIIFSSPLNIGPGETLHFGGLRWLDSEFNVNGQGGGMGEKSPLHPSLLPDNRPRNVLLYLNGDSEAILCDNLNPNIIFHDGDIYDIIIN